MSSLREKIIKKMGGYTSLDDALEGTDKNEVLSLAVQDLFNAVGPEDILRRIGTVFTFEGKQINNSLVGLLAAEAHNFSSSRLWDVLKAELRFQANLKMFEKSRTVDDIIAGKLMLFCIKVIDDKLRGMLQELPKLPKGSEGDDFDE